jgi:hypothetical protein
VTRRGPDADAGDLELTDRLDDRVEGTAHRRGESEPHLRSWRRGRGRPEPHLDFDVLDRAVRCANAGRIDVKSALAHLTYAGRSTCGLAAPSWARDEVLRLVDNIDDDAMDALADELEREGHDVARRLRRMGSP